MLEQDADARSDCIRSSMTLLMHDDDVALEERENTKGEMNCKEGSQKEKRKTEE